MQQILTIQVNPLDAIDKLVWTGTKSGCYTVKNGYNLIREEIERNQKSEQASSSYQTPRALWQAIWNVQILPKIKIFPWSIRTNAIPSKENLLPDPVCSLCRQGVETVEHIFLLCPWTQLVWADPRLKIQFNNQEISRLDDWLTKFTVEGADVPRMALVATTLWCSLEILQQLGF